MIRQTDSPIIDMVCRLMVPIIMLFGLYVIFHGHYSPGGGFQGGALLVACVLFTRLTFGDVRSEGLFPRRFGTPFSVLGVGIFAGTGVLCLAGGNYLDYGRLPLAGMGPAELRSLGILMIEIGVAFGVLGTLVAIFDDIGRGEER